MKISLLDAGKRFNREWIFRHFNYQFLQGEHYAITGPNGSGKSTLLQVIAGAVMHSEGEIRYESTDTGSGIPVKNKIIIETEYNKESKVHQSMHPDPVSGIRYQKIHEPYKHLSFSAPYLELIEEMTAMEFLKFHAAFKPLTSTNENILEETGLGNAAVKQIRYFSSGMKQRLKLAQAFFSDTPVLLLDEPATNLDEEGMRLYHSLINKYAQKRTVIVSSNDIHEYDFCKAVIRIGDYK